MHSRKADMAERMARIAAICVLVFAPAALAQTAPAAGQSLADVAARSACAEVFWQDRGRAPAGYIKGLAQVYAKATCDLRRKSDSAARVMARPLQSPREDALAWYGAAGSRPQERLRELFTLMIGHGMRESTGNPTEGRDMTVMTPSAENAEAGLFQTSYDSLDRHPWLSRLISFYRAHPENCLTDVFMAGSRDRREPVFGTGPGADYQALMKSCPALAAEYDGVMLRVNRTHFSPINGREAEMRAECRAMLDDIEPLVDCAAP